MFRLLSSYDFFSPLPPSSCNYFLMNIFTKSRIRATRYLGFVNDRNYLMKHQRE